MALDIEKFETKSDEEKQDVVDTILGLATCNTFTKTDLLHMLRWQRDRTAALSGHKMQAGEVCDGWSMYEEE